MPFNVPGPIRLDTLFLKTLKKPPVRFPRIPLLDCPETTLLTMVVLAPEIAIPLEPPFILLFLTVHPLALILMPVP
jgi:hypothetical protein